MAMAIERKNSFHLLLSDDELKLLKLLADRDGLNASDYLRSILRREAGTPAHLRHAAVFAQLAAGRFGAKELEWLAKAPAPAAAEKGKKKPRAK